MLEPLSKISDQFRLLRPYTSDVIELRCLFKNLSPFVVHVFWEQKWEAPSASLIEIDPEAIPDVD